jgi:hypothetical protein
MRFVPDETPIKTPRPCYVVVLISDGAGRYLLAHIRDGAIAPPADASSQANRPKPPPTARHTRSRARS